MFLETPFINFFLVFCTSKFLSSKISPFHFRKTGNPHEHFPNVFPYQHYNLLFLCIRVCTTVCGKSNCANNKRMWTMIAVSVQRSTGQVPKITQKINKKRRINEPKMIYRNWQLSSINQSNVQNYTVSNILIKYISQEK